MNCSDLQLNLSLYADDRLDAAERSVVDEHLAICPLCRQNVAEIREIKADFRQFARRAMPVAVSNYVRLAVRSELRGGRSNWISDATREWLSMRLMPLGVGVAASLVIGFSLLMMMFSAARSSSDVVAKNGGNETRIMIAPNRENISDGRSFDLSAEDYARTRLAFSGESPSINPKGALIALTRTFMRGNMNDDEVVVVADVFSNGLAQITEVVEPSRNGNAVTELEKALESDGNYAPFVPAVLDNRSENVRVVLRFQSVNVSTNEKRKKR